MDVRDSYLHRCDSNDSISSIEEESTISEKPKFFPKLARKSLPVSINSKRTDLFLSSNSQTGSLPGSLQRSLTPEPHPLPPLDSSSSSCLLRRDVFKKMIWNIYVSDLGQWLEVDLPHSSCCSLLLHKVLTNLHRGTDLINWSIMEQNSEQLLERFVEDYEIIDDISLNQDSDQISRFCLSHTPAKYSILLHPEICLPYDMLVFPQKLEIDENVPDRIRRDRMHDILTKTAPELCGWLYVREFAKKSWRKLYCILRNSGLYYSSKGTSKEPQHMVCLAEVHSARVWFPINKKKQANWPTAFSFCLKPHSLSHGASTRWFCAENKHLWSAWISSLRLTMNGSRFHESYLSALRCGTSNLIRSSSDRAINKYESNFVPMDFRGPTGRIIQDPTEIAMVEKEREMSWRRRLYMRNGNMQNGHERGIGGNSSPSRSNTYIARVIHETQPWFRSKMTREEAIDEIQRYGNLDGTFLLRDSQSIQGGLVVTVCFNQKPRHIPISFVEKDGQTFFTIDNGETRFLDLIQFVDFHKINKGRLPCPLLYECSNRFP